VAGATPAAAEKRLKLCQSLNRQQSLKFMISFGKV